MSTKRYLTFIFLPLLAVLAAGTIALVVPPLGGIGRALPAEAGTTSALVVPPSGGIGRARPAETGTTSADVTLAAQKARLTLSDGRTATFAFACSAGTLTAHAAIGLDQECNYLLQPLADPLPPPPAPDPVPGPAPSPQPVPKPLSSNLRVLFIYDPMALAALAAPRQAILASPELRAYLEKHCPLEANCANGMCLANAKHTASYRFLPATADISALPAVWQGIFNAARGKPAPWLLVVNEAGQTVVDQPWPESVEATLALLKKYGGDE
jgi:hypothetical protein